MQEGCSGDAARRAGNEHLFQMLAETNLATFEEIESRRSYLPVLTVSTLGNRVQDFGQDIEVMHHSQLINHLQRKANFQSHHTMEKSLTTTHVTSVASVGN